VQQAIAAEVKLDYVMQHWNEIAAALAERDRQRVPQLARYHVLS
jgi:DNA-binding FadR family transcriptional regulator